MPPINFVSPISVEVMLPMLLNHWEKKQTDDAIKHNHLQEAHEQFKLPVCAVAQQRPECFSYHICHSVSGASSLRHPPNLGDTPRGEPEPILD
jgi:hypothetical protein